MATNPTSRRDFLTVGSLGFLGLTLRDTLLPLPPRLPRRPRRTA